MDLQEHLKQAEKYAESLTKKLGLDQDVAQAIVQAAKNHDLGKDRPWWQRAIHNKDPQHPLAKNNRGFEITLNAGYRHEFGSLLQLTDSHLTRHLVVSHHGYGRPVIPDRAFDRKKDITTNEKARLYAIRQFGLLQKQYGWWGLAYLEALLKAVDVMASK